MMTGLQNIMTTELINNDDWITKHNDNRAN